MIEGAPGGPGVTSPPQLTVTPVFTPSSAPLTPTPTPQPTLPPNCIYEVTRRVRKSLRQNEPVTAPGLTISRQGGDIVFTFTEPRTISKIVSQLKGRTSVTVNVEGEDFDVPTSPGQVVDFSFPSPQPSGVITVVFKDLKPRDIKKLVVEACREEATTEEPEETTELTGPAETTAPVDDCVYQVEEGELTKAEPKKPFNAARAILRPNGTVVFAFDEPRLVTSVTTNFNYPVVIVVRSDSEPRRRIPVAPGGEVYTPIVPAATGVVRVKIVRPNNKPIRPKQIKLITVVACEEVTTPVSPKPTTSVSEAPSPTPSSQSPCLHKITQEELPEKELNGGDVSYEKGRIVFSFDEEKRITRVVTRLLENVPVVAVLRGSDNKKIAIVPLLSDLAEDTVTPIDYPGVVKVIIRRAEKKKKLTRAQIRSFVVNACEMAPGVSTTPTPAPSVVTVTGTAAPNATTPLPHDCVVGISRKDLKSGKRKDFEGGFIKMKPSGELSVVFDEPTEIVGVRAKVARNPFILVIPIGDDGLAGDSVQAAVDADELVETPMDVTSRKFKIMGAVKRLDKKGVLRRIQLVKASCAKSTTPAPTNTPAPTTAEEPQDCQYLPWGPWSACSKTCGLGTQTKERSSIPARNGGKPCNPNRLVKERDCAAEPCAVDCVLSQWSDWTECSATCGGGLKTRDRQTETPASNGGQDCDPILTELESCNQAKCDEECTDGKVYFDCSEGNEPDVCPLTCEAAMNPSVACVEEERQCQEGCYCPKDYVQKDGTCVPVSECKVCEDADGNQYPLGGGKIKKPETCEECECTEDKGLVCGPDPTCSKDCELEWSEWGVCSATCGGGVKTKYRTVVKPAIGDGECKGPKTKTKPCARRPCPEEPSSTPEPGTCQVEERVEDISIDDGRCVAEGVELDVCGGYCPSMQFIDDKLNLVSACDCCTGEVETKMVEFDCGDGQTETHAVPYHSSCGCNQCSRIAKAPRGSDGMMAPDEAEELPEDEAGEGGPEGPADEDDIPPIVRGKGKGRKGKGRKGNRKNKGQKNKGEGLPPIVRGEGEGGPSGPTMEDDLPPVVRGKGKGKKNKRGKKGDDDFLPPIVRGKAKAIKKAIRKAKKAGGSGEFPAFDLPKH